MTTHDPAAAIFQQIKAEKPGLIVYHGKHCMFQGCGLGLTSANRYNLSSLCREHGLKHERERKAKAKARHAAADAPPVVPPETRRVLVLPLHLHFAFCAWLDHPGTEETMGPLKAAMGDYELRHRLRRTLPALPLPSQSTNPGA